jgi:chloramphenicol-sensitive protein RarD
MKNNLGLIYALAAYTWWGFIPIFWKQLDHVGSADIVMHRMVWSCVLVIGLIVLMKQWRQFIVLFSQPKTLFRLFIASSLVSINWGVFIWAVNDGRLVETSMGYFINPLISVLLGVVFFAERLRKGQLFALSIAMLGVLYLVIAYGTFPWVALTLAVTFALYAVAKKSISVPATHGMAVETLFFVVPALAYLSYIQSNGTGQFLDSSFNAWMLILGGLFTLIPLLLFAAAASIVTMSVLGMTQYIGPSLQLLIGLFLYGEPFGSDRMISFGLIWLALAVYSIDQIRHQRNSRKLKKTVIA